MKLKRPHPNANWIYHSKQQMGHGSIFHSKWKNRLLPLAPLPLRKITANIYWIFTQCANHWILITPWGRYSYGLHFTGEQNEPQRLRTLPKILWLLNYGARILFVGCLTPQSILYSIQMFDFKGNPCPKVDLPWSYSRLSFWDPLLHGLFLRLWEGPRNVLMCFL